MEIKMTNNLISNETVASLLLLILLGAVLGFMLSFYVSVEVKTLLGVKQTSFLQDIHGNLSHHIVGGGKKQPREERI